MAAKAEEALPLVRERRTHDRRASVPVKWTYERWVLTLTLLGGLLGGTFGFGIQWAKTTEVRAMVEANANIAVRRDVYDADQRQLAGSIDRLTAEMERLRNSLEEERERQRRLERTPAFGR